MSGKNLRDSYWGWINQESTNPKPPNVSYIRSAIIGKSGKKKKYPPLYPIYHYISTYLHHRKLIISWNEIGKTIILNITLFIFNIYTMINVFLSIKNPQETELHVYVKYMWAEYITRLLHNMYSYPCEYQFIGCKRLFPAEFYYNRRQIYTLIGSQKISCLKIT